MFEGQRAFVTGGGTGIGRACALALAAEGCFVTVAGRTERTLDEAVRAIVAAGGSAEAVQCDVTVEAMVQEEIADAVVWLASPRASYVTGVALPIDGGLTAS